MKDEAPLAVGAPTGPDGRIVGGVGVSGDHWADGGTTAEAGADRVR